MESIFKFFNKNEYFISTILFISFFVLFFVFKENIYFTIDEIESSITYSHFPEFFLKTSTNNHFLTTVIGTLLTNFFGYNILLLKFISLVSLILIILIFYKLIVEKNLIYIFFIIILSSNFLIEFIFSYRGYYFSSFIFCWIYYLIFQIQNKINYNKIKLIFFLNALLITHLLTSILISIPILVILSIWLYFFKKLNFLNILKLSYFFFVPLFFIFFFQIIITGIIVNSSSSEIINLLNFKQNSFFSIIFFKELFILFENDFLQGFKTYFFSDYLKSKGQYVLTYEFFKEEKIFFFIFVCSLLYALVNFFRKKNIIFSLIILSFFILFYLINRFPHEYSHIGHIFFFIFFLMKCIEDEFSLKIKNKYIKIFSLLALSVLLISIPFRYSPTWMFQHEYREYFNKFDCKLDVKNNIINNKVEKTVFPEIYYFVLLDKCNEKYDQKKYYNLIKSIN